MSVAEVVPGPIVREKVSRDTMVQRGFMLIIALYLVITLAFPLYAMLSKAFLTYQFNLEQFNVQASNESGNFNTPAVTMKALNAEVRAFDGDNPSAKSGSRLSPSKLFPEFSFKSPVLYRISGNDETAVFLVGSERHVGTEVVEVDSNTFRRVAILPVQGTGISNFTRYFSTPALSRSIGNSLFIALLSTVITVSLAFWFAYALSRSCMKYKGFFKLVAMAPILVPSLLPGIALIYLFGNQGILKAFLMGNTIYGPIGIVVGSVFFTFPHAMLIIGTALSISDGRLYEAATALRASKWRTFWTVTVPSARYGLISAAFVVFNLVITDFGLPKVIGGQFNVLAVDIYKQVIGQQNFEMGAVVSVILLLPAILAFAIDRYNQKKQVVGISARSVVFEPKPNAKADTGWFIYCSLVAFFIIGIIAICQYAALVKFWPYDLSLSLNNYDFDKMDGGGWSAYGNSIKLALLTAFFGTIVVFMGAYVVEKTKGFHKSRALFQMLAMLPMAIPGMVLGLAYIFFFNNPANPSNVIYGTMTILVVSTVTHFYTVSHLTALTALKQMDPEFESVSASLKQPFFKLFGRVTVPVCVPAILNISIYLFVNAMTTVSGVVFLYSTDTALASIAVLNMDDAGDIAPAAAMGMMIFYTNAGARLLHTLGSRMILKRSNAWRES